MSESIQLPAESVDQAATSVISAGKSSLAMMFWMDGIFVVAAIAILTKETRDFGTMLGGLAFWAVVLAFLTRRPWKRVKTARAAQLAAKSGQMTWLLSERLIVAVNERNIPLGELSFKIPRGTRQLLLAVPQARVVER
jgi:hypothetical protein